MIENNDRKTAGITEADFDAVLCELKDLFLRKNADYGNSFSETFAEEGLAAVRIRIGDKFNRFKTLSKNTAGSMVRDESIRDTLRDTANYAILAICMLDKETP